MNVHHTIKKPSITEKNLSLHGPNCYAFEVDPDANKQQIKAAVETQFGVQVISVRTLTQKAVAKRTGRRRIPSMSTLSKKALVTIKKGQTIETLQAKG